VSVYNRANVLIHYFIPFFIQVISITVVVIQTICHRARTSNSRQQTFIDLFKKQFKEHYVTPIIIVFSSLPQIIPYAFRQTVIGKILVRQQRALTDKQLNIKMVTRPINQTAPIAPPS